MTTPWEEIVDRKEIIVVKDHKGRRKKLLIIGDTQYELDRYYMEGVKAARNSIPFYYNPYRDGCTAHYQWSYAHDNEFGGDHEGLNI